MFSASREALQAISQILHEAGWDQPEEPDRESGRPFTSRLFEDLTDEELAAYLLIHEVAMSPSEVAQQTGHSEETVRGLYESYSRKLRDRALNYLRRSRSDSG